MYLFLVLFSTYYAENVSYFQMLKKITFLELGWYNLQFKIVQSLL